jgi:alkylation response protein AidB-like acyl-CoA dehydrogenase
MFVANQSVQLHGGIGMTDEYVIGQYYKRLFTFEAIDGQCHAPHPAIRDAVGRAPIGLLTAGSVPITLHAHPRACSQLPT